MDKFSFNKRKRKARERKMDTYILILGFTIPFLDLKCMLPGQKIIIPCYPIWGCKNVNIHTCPTMSITNLDQHIDNNQSVSCESQISMFTE
jgi:hypothetical protein